MKTKYINRPSSYMPIEQLKIWLKEQKELNNNLNKKNK
jgi:hypothetical protein